MLIEKETVGITDPRALAELASWYNSLPTHKPANWPARGTIAAALVVLERLKSDFDLSLESHRAPGKSQIKGVSGAAVARILVTHGVRLGPFSERAVAPIGAVRVGLSRCSRR